VRVDVADRAIVGLRSGQVLTGSDPKAANSFVEPNKVVASAFDALVIDGGKAALSLPPLSVVAATLALG